MHPALVRHHHHPHPFHREAEHGPGPAARPFSADERRLWLARLDLARRNGHITAAHVEIGRTLLKRQGADGRLDPSHATLATDSGYAERTVREALNRLRALSLLSWTQRIELIPWPAGGVRATRPVQTSNAYRLLLPDRPPPRRPAVPTGLRSSGVRGGSSCRETPLQVNQGGRQETNWAWAQATLATAEPLEAVRARRQAALAEAWMVRRRQLAESRKRG